jgi:hypothetical protein
MMRKHERKGWFLMLFLFVVVRVLWAMGSDIAPFVLTNSAGSPLFVMGTDGFLQTAGVKSMTGTSQFVFKNASGTAIGGFAANGSILATNTDNASSTAIAQSSPSEEVTATFLTAEADTNYKIIGVLEDTATTTATLWVKRRTTAGFVVGAVNVNDGTTFFTWTKVRTQ